MIPGMPDEAYDRALELAVTLARVPHMGATVKRRQKAITQFERWAEANKQPGVPTTETVVLRFLHSHYDRWGAGSVDAMVDALRWVHASGGHPDPTSEAVRVYCAGVRRIKGRRTRPRVEALDLAQLTRAAAAQMVAAYPGGRAMELRAHVAALLCRASNRPLRAVQHIKADDVTIGEDGATVVIGGTTFALRRTEGPLDLIGPLEELMSCRPQDAPLLLGFGQDKQRNGVVPTSRPVAVVVRSQLLKAAKRAGIAVVALGPDRTGTELPAEELGWLLAHLNPDLARQSRDRAYALIGAGNASRHSDLARLRISDVEHTDQGFLLHFRRTKTNPEQRDELTLDRPVEHEGDGGVCPAWCPACALCRWMLVLTRAWGSGPEDLLMPALRGSLPSGPLNDWDGTLLLRRLLGRDDLSTRSMRAGAITALHAELKGDDDALVRIQEVSGHRSLKQLTRYLRLIDPHVDQLHLDPPQHVAPHA